jgi:general stress protein 26
MSKSTEHPKVFDFMKKHPLGVLSTVSTDGTPWGAAIYYIVDEDFNIYFVTRSKTFKYSNLEKNPKAALTVTDGESQITIQLTGEVSAMPVQKYMDVFFEKFAALRPRDDYQWAPPIDKIHEGNYMPLQLTPSKLQFADFGKQRIETHGDYIEHILP